MLCGADASATDSNKIPREQLSNSGLTIDKLPEIKTIFEKAAESRQGETVKISKIQELAKGSSMITEADICEFFKEFINRGIQDISPADFEVHVAKIERNLLEMCLGGKGDVIKDQPEYVGAVLQDSIESPDKLSQMPKEDEKIEGHYLGPDDYTLDDYITTIREMLTHTLTNDNYLDLTLPEIAKLIKDINSYVNVIKKKADKLNEELKTIKNTLENKEYQENFLQNKIKNYQETIDELQNAKEKLEHSVENMFKMEAEYAKLREKNEDLNMQLVTSLEETQKLSSLKEKMEREFKTIKRKNEELERDVMDARSDKNELLVELEETRKNLESVKEELIKKDAGNKSEGKNEQNPESKTESPAASVSGSVILKTSGEMSDTSKKEEKANEGDTKKKFFDLKKKYDSLQSKIDVFLLNSR